MTTTPTPTTPPLPCPFCGSPATEPDYFSPLESILQLHCSGDCPIGLSADILFTVSEWNRRAPAAPAATVTTDECHGPGNRPDGMCRKGWDRCPCDERPAATVAPALVLGNCQWCGSSIAKCDQATCDGGVPWRARCCDPCSHPPKMDQFLAPAPSLPLAELDELETKWKTAIDGAEHDSDDHSRFHELVCDAFPALAATIRAQAERVRALTEAVEVLNEALGNISRRHPNMTASGEYRRGMQDAFNVCREVSLEALARIQSLVGGAGEKEQGK